MAELSTAALLAKSRRATFVQDEVENGTHSVTDADQEGFFKRGRDFEAVGDAHSYTAQEQKVLESFESIEYLPPNNAIYRAYLGDPSAERPTQTSRWVAMGLIGLTVGFVGFLLKSTIDRIGEWRRSLLFDVECRGDPTHPELYSCGYISHVAEAATSDEPTPPGGTMEWLFPTYAGVAVAFACAAASVVVLIEPAAASSGIPEVIAYLNGTHQRKIFALKTLVIKFISCFLAVGSGMAVGPEGPMIHMGSMMGRGVSQMRSQALGCTLPFFRHFRNTKDERDFITAGSAAGVASAFGAPVGGLLFALEEVASTWSQTLTWQIFFCAMSAASTTIVLSSAFGGYEFSGRFGQLHAGGPNSAIEFYVSDAIDVNILLFIPSILIGLTCGVLGALFTFVNLKVAKFRRQRIAPHKPLRVLEPMTNMLILAALTFLFTLAYPCTSVADHAHPEVLAEGMLVRLQCDVGEYNELATLMYASGHHAVLLLFSRRSDTTGDGRTMFGAGSVLIFLAVYFIMACCAAGSAVSSGLVVPMLLIGACVGRIYGVVFLACIGLPTSLSACPSAGDVPLPGDVLAPECYWSFVDPGAFALIGAAAFFGGVSRLTIALTVIMIEITNDVRFLLPIMLAVMVAKWVADGITHSLYHAIIEAKCLPFLSPEVSLHGARDGDLERFTVADLLSSLPTQTTGSVVTLEMGKETYRSVAVKLGDPDKRHGAYPVVDREGRFEGTVTRGQLLAMLDGAARGGSALSTPEGVGYLQMLTEVEGLVGDPQKVSNALERCSKDEGLAIRPFDLAPYVNASAFAVRDVFSLHRAYMLFRTMGLRHLVVTNADNHVAGVLTRRDLMDFRLHEVLHPHGHHDDHGDGHGGGHGGVHAHLGRAHGQSNAH